MKTVASFFSFFFFSTFLFCQIPFAPMGAVWVQYGECEPGGPPPVTYNNTVTEDSTIQGKYCTRIMNSGWPCYQGSFAGLFVHYEDGKVYRWDHENSQFHLVLDYTKEVGESWRIPVCEEVFWTDSVTITVNQKDGIYRNVSIAVDSSGEYDLIGLDLYEGFGGVIGNKLLLYGAYVIAHPACWTSLVCYEDPINGLLYGNSPCLTATNERLAGDAWAVSPNPTGGELTVDFLLEKPAVVRLTVFDILGRLAKTFQEEKLPSGQHQLQRNLDLPSGVYLLKLSVDGVVGVKKVLVR